MVANRYFNKIQYNSFSEKGDECWNMKRLQYILKPILYCWFINYFYDQFPIKLILQINAIRSDFVTILRSCIGYCQVRNKGSKYENLFYLHFICIKHCDADWNRIMKSKQYYRTTESKLLTLYSGIHAVLEQRRGSCLHYTLESKQY